MSTMMQAYPSKTFVDDEMKPLVSGRLTVYVHDSNVKADVFTLEGANYVPCDNPMRLDEAGRLVASIFTELGVYDVKLEKYNGDGTFEDFDHYEIGIDAKLDQIGRDSVDSIEDLMNLDPTVCSDVVTVMDYPVRNYLWDAQSIDTPDGGVVVDSDVAPTGRWLLLWESPYLNSAVYGVKDGDTTNINALFNYPEIIGSMNIHTPPAIRLLSSTYDLGGYFICKKHLALEPGMRINGTIGLYDDLELFGRKEPESYIGDFNFLHSGCSAHSSWFKNVNDFWHCGADILYVDETNSFYNSTLSQMVNLSGKTVVGTGTKVNTYANGTYFQLALDSTVPDNFFIPNKDYVRISGTGFGDNVFRTTGSWDPGLINQGHHIQFDQTPDLDMFADTKRWLGTMLERRNRLSSVMWSDYTLDLQGRTADSLYLGDASFTTIKNGNFTGTITCAGYSVTFDNVRASLRINFTHANNLIFASHSKLTIERYHSGLGGIQASDSDISILGAEGIDPCDCGITMYGGSFSGIIKMSTDHCNAYLLNKQIIFQNVRILDGFSWKLNYLQMVGCYSSGKIDLYPAAGGDGKFYYNLLMSDNKFVGNFRLWITYYYDSDHPHYEVRGTAVKFNMMKIVNNRFDTVDAHAIKMTQWHISYMEPYIYTTYADQNMGTWEYSGNSGNCPKMAPPRIDNYGNWTHHYEYPSGPHHYYRSNDTYYLFMPYDYEPGGSNGAPNSMLDPANPVNQVTALIQEENTDGDWADCDVWYANGLSTPENLENEDYNNRFLVYVWLSKPLWSTDTANYNHNGYTTFVRSGS